MNRDLDRDGIPASSDAETILKMHVAGRIGHGAILRGNKLVIWGGHTNLEPTKKGFLIVNLETGKKRMLEPTVDLESQSRFLVMDRDWVNIVTCYSYGAYAVQGNFLYTFGGNFLETDELMNYFFRFEFCQQPKKRKSRESPEDVDRLWIDEVNDSEPQEHIKLTVMQASSETMPGEPSPRVFHSLFIYDNRAYSFGGEGPSMHLGYLHNHGIWQLRGNDTDNCGWNNQLLVYDFLQDRWEDPCTSGSVPSPRCGHAMTRVGTSAYLFGGRSEKCFNNDLYCLDLNHLQWTVVSARGDVPSPRLWPSLTRLDDGHLFVFGGLKDFRSPVGDGHVLDLKDHRFRLAVRSNEVNQRSLHAAGLTDDDRVIVVGGFDDDIKSPSGPVHMDDFLQMQVAQPPSLYAACLRYCSRNISAFSRDQLNKLNHFVRLDLLNMNRLAQRFPPL